MNKETCWMFKPNNAAISEMMQRTAFNYGYKWCSGDIRPLYYTSLFPLVFIPENKTITMCCYGVNITATSLEQALEYFKNPPNPKIKEVPGAVLNVDGSIKLTGGLLSREAFDLLVKTRAEFMGVAK